MQPATIIEELWFEPESAAAANQTAAASFAARLTQAQGLKTFPAVAQTILSIFANDQFRVGEVVEAIEEDPSLASSVLRMANSAFFVSNHPVTEMNQAFMRIGAQHVKEIVCAVATMEMFNDVDGLGMQIRDHCAAVAGLSHFLAREYVRGKLEGLFLAGLLHDIGKLMLLDSNEMDYHAGSPSTLTPDLTHIYEQKRLGYDHAVLAGHIAATWNFGAIISRAIAWHHQPKRALAHEKLSKHVAALRLADQIDYILLAANEDYERDAVMLEKTDEARLLQISASQLLNSWGDLYRVRNDALITFSPRNERLSSAGAQPMY
ncbi:MAG: HDOD domain-containing protein [Deltaproteobacteria bacterium]|nr:HDOD domain-containing protein [Deltaproteobacteria bacterium]MBN2673487.1 HDOD domain-containing protein [Deltaproteobacteria bacterium]